MKLQIVQFNWNSGGGSATIYIAGPAPESELNPPQYFVLQTGFHTRRACDLVSHPEQESILIPGQSDRWLVVGFLGIESVNVPREYPQPSPSSYRRQIARLLANIAANVQLDDLAAPIPTVICL